MSRRGEQFPDNGFEAWGGYMNAKIAKLEEQFSVKANQDQLLSNIFNGISIYVNGYTIPSADELKALMVKHGGIYHTYKRIEDFIIATNLPDTKVKNMSLTKVVKPEWITDSISANQLLNYKDYLLYKNMKSQMQLNFNKCVQTDSSANSIKVCKTNCALEEALQNSDSIKFNLQSLQDSSVNTIEKNTEKFEIKADLVVKQCITKTAADPNFISEFYNNSRLHHISQLGAHFKQYVNDLREENIFSFPKRFIFIENVKSLNIGKTYSSPQLIFEKEKIIMHIDMDCFFVSVGLRNRPDLFGKPVAVTHSKGGLPKAKREGVDRSTEFNLYKQRQAKKISRDIGIPEEDIEFESRVDNITDEDDKYSSMSEIASCSYEARAKGIKNGMFMGAALKLCPELQTIPYDFEGYREVAHILYNTIAQYTLDIEAVSCDEMYVDCTNLLKEMNVSVQDFATILRDEIKRKTGCPCSTGFGGNRLQARLATKRAKPDGQFFLTEDIIENVMYDVQLKDLPGVGRQISQKLESLGHATCGSLQSVSLATLKCHLGVKTGAQLFDQCRGRDTNPLSFVTVRKSVSAEVNYGIRFENNIQCSEFLKQLSAEVHSRMIQFKVVGKCITLKLMIRAEEAPVETAKFMGHGFCNVLNKSSTLLTTTNDKDTISNEVIALWKKNNIDPKDLRGIGIQITKLEPLNNKPIKGTINRYLKSNVIKTESNSDKEVLTIADTLKQAITPRKTQVFVSPKKKSPIIGLIKSPTGRRGRPPKIAKIQNNTSTNLMTKFLHCQNVTKDTPYRDPMIRNTSTNINLKEHKHQIVAEPKIINENPNGLLNLPWEKVRDLLRAWLDSGLTPLPCDIEMIASYLHEMVVNKKIEKVRILLNFIRRRTSELCCSDWTDTYDFIVQQVQNAMMAVYGKRLMIGDN